MDAATDSAPAAAATSERIAVVELRQYVFEPDHLDSFVVTFESLLEPIEERRARVLGYFRDADDPSRFVWLRGFADMATRKTALEGFYTSDPWHENREAVNAHLLDFSNVLLLRPAGELKLDRAAQPAEPRETTIAARIWPLTAPIPEATLSALNKELDPRLQDPAAPVAALLITDPRQNNFPNLPIREGETVLALVTREIADAANARHAVEAAIQHHRAGDAETRRLRPATLSRIA